MEKENQARICAAKKTSIGGQALMEGIMMRGPHKTVMAVRNPEGKIVVEEVESGRKKRPAICRWPFVRGLFGYFDSMALGYKCLMRSAEIAGLEDVVEESPSKKKKREQKEAAANAAKETDSAEQASAATEPSAAPVTEPEVQENESEEAFGEGENGETAACAETDGRSAEKKDEEKLPAWVMPVLSVASMVLGIGLAVGLFILLPSVLFDLFAKAVPAIPSWEKHNVVAYSLSKSVFEGVLRILLLVGYMALISLMKDIRRTFMFHGAEHKSIFCYEAGLELTVENVKKQRRFHPRCGTSFLILMLLVGIFISFFIDPLSYLISGNTLPTVWRVLVKLLLLPLIVGAGYELIKLAGRHDNVFTRILSAPGVWLQHLTVLEPTDDMIECAITALREVIPQDDSDKW